LALIAVGEAAVNLCLSILLVRRMGVIGVAWGTAIPHIISTGIVLPYFTLRTVDMNVGYYFRKTYLMPIVCAIPVALLSYTLVHFSEPATWYALIADLLIQCLAFGLLGYFVCLNRGERGVLRQTLGRIIRRQRTIGEEMARATGA
jgi:Na+-driven multidrug efflux pump